MLYVRAAGPDAKATGHALADLVAAAEDGGQLRSDALVSFREDGPFEPLIPTARRNAAFRDALAREIRIPSLRDYKRVRVALAAIVALPLVLLLELDRELAFGGKAGPSRVLVDLVLVAWIVFELSRPTPRMPKIAATCLGAIALRWVLVETRLCGWHVHPVVWASSVLAVVAALVFLLRVPSRDRVTLELLGKLGISRSEHVEAARTRPPPGALVAAAVACAAGLPAILHVARAAGASYVVQTLAFLLFAAVAPLVARQIGEPERAPPAPWSEPPARILLAVATGLALTAAAVTVGRLFFDAGADIAQCVNRLDTEARLARAAESQELARAVERVRGSAPLVMLTAAVSPFAEERVFRGLLQDVLVRKYGPAFGIVATALAFGLAHLGVYEVALYQTVLLGVGFGVAYAEGGLLAAFFVHAVWNLLQVA